MKALKKKRITLHGLADPELTLAQDSNLVFDHERLLVTLGRVAKPLVSCLTPVP